MAPAERNAEARRNRRLHVAWEGRPPRRKVGLALGGGAARGIAHIGVLQVLEEHQVPIDCIAGTSAGALVGGLYAAGISPQRLEELVAELNWGELTNLHMPWLGLLGFDRIVDWILEILGGPVTFADLRIPFAAVTVDIVSGELVVINEGEVAPALRASCSVPGVFSPFRYRQRLLVDGGTLNNLPVSVVERLGGEYIIAVDLLPPGSVGGHEPQNVLELTVTALYMLMRATHNEAQDADYVIYPAIGHIGLADLSKSAELIQAGRQAAEVALPEFLAELELAQD
jgi:NTE family protein